MEQIADHSELKRLKAINKRLHDELKNQQPKKGKWQPYKYGDDTWHQCSVCGVADRYINIIKRDGCPDYRMVCIRNFCPNCGADMRDEQERPTI